MFLPRCVRSNDGHDERVECHVRSRENYFFLPPSRRDFDGPYDASSGGARRRAASKKHGRRRARSRATCVCTLVHRKFCGIHVDGPNGRPTECCNLAPAPFLSILFLRPHSTRLFLFDKSPRDFSRWIERSWVGFWTTIDVLWSIRIESLCIRE